MDIFTFIAQMTQALAWPVAVLAIFLIYRRQIAHLLTLVEHLRFEGIEVEFGRGLAELKRTVERELPKAEAPAAAEPRLRERLLQLAALSPRAVVLEAWLVLEEAALDVLKRRNINLSSREAHTPILLGHALEEAGVFDEGKQEIFLKLRNLRNAAAHAGDFRFEADSAMEYADAAFRLAAYLRGV